MTPDEYREIVLCRLPHTNERYLTHKLWSEIGQLDELFCSDDRDKIKERINGVDFVLSKVQACRRPNKCAPEWDPELVPFAI